MRAQALLSSIRPRRRYLFLLLFAVLLAACAPGTPTEAEPAPTDVDTEFTLRSESRDGGLVYVGVGGDIDGEVNPTLVVSAGERVRLHLINGTGMQHNIAIRELDVASSFISGAGSETFVDLETTTPQGLTYFCEVAGHAAAGMEGQLIVE